jgi:hypothetical protein
MGGKKRKVLSADRENLSASAGGALEVLELEEPYLGGAGVNPSRLWPGSGLGLGLGAFLTSFLPLSLLPMSRSLTQKGRAGKDINAEAG